LSFSCNIIGMKHFLFKMLLFKIYQYINYTKIHMKLILSLHSIQLKILNLHEMVLPKVIQFQGFRRSDKVASGAKRRSDKLSASDRFWNIASHIRLRVERYTCVDCITLTYIL